MRAALAQPDRRTQISQVLSAPAPSGGINSRDSALRMPPTDARVLVNCIARPGFIEVRNGVSDWVTGFGADPVETLMSYSPSGSSPVMFAAAGAMIHNVTTAGVVDLNNPAVDTLTSSRWQYVNFANSVTNWLIAVNGADDMLVFDGTTWTTTADLGVTVDTADLVAVTVYQKRLFFLEKNSRLIHFLAAGAISGTAGTLAFEQLMKRGGKIQAIGTWSVDAGDGLDDLFVAVTSEGEAIVFAGIDPTDPDLWSLKGVYFVGKPVGDRCLFNVGSELFVLTERGVYPMSRALSESASKRESYLTDKINQLFISYSAKWGLSTYGWQAEVSTYHNVLLVNAPSRGTAQFVMDLSTGGWSLFTGLKAHCWLSFGNDLYYGADGKVVRALANGVHNDFETNKIFGLIGPAYSSFNIAGQNKHIKMFRPMFVSMLPFIYHAAIVADLSDSRRTTTDILTTLTDASYWNAGRWDDAVWNGRMALTREWHSIESWPGSYLAIYLKIDKDKTPIEFHGIDYAAEVGGLI